MRRVLITLVAVVSSFGVLAPAHATPIPPCAYLVQGDFTYSLDPKVVTVPTTSTKLAVPQSTPHVKGSITLSAPSCTDDGYTYSIVVLDGTTHSIVLNSEDLHGNGWSTPSGEGVLDFSVPVDTPTPNQDDSPGVCVYFTTSYQGSQLDYAPNDGSPCYALDLSASGSWHFH